MGLCEQFRTMLRVRIQELGVSKNRVADMLGCSPQNVNQLLRTKVTASDPNFGKNHKLETVEKFADVLGMEVELTWAPKKEQAEKD